MTASIITPTDGMIDTVSTLMYHDTGFKRGNVFRVVLDEVLLLLKLDADMVNK